MGQSELIEALEKLTKPCSRGEIANFMKEDPIKVSHWLATLVKHCEVMVQNLSRQEAAAKYNCKRGIRLYYVKQEDKKQNGK
jgi:hypothetical protein